MPSQNHVPAYHRLHRELPGGLVFLARVQDNADAQSPAMRQYLPRVLEHLLVM